MKINLRKKSASQRAASPSRFCLFISERLPHLGQETATVTSSVVMSSQNFYVVLLKFSISILKSFINQCKLFSLFIFIFFFFTAKSFTLNLKLRLIQKHLDIVAVTINWKIVSLPFLPPRYVVIDLFFCLCSQVECVPHFGH